MAIDQSNLFVRLRDEYKQAYKELADAVDKLNKMAASRDLFTLYDEAQVVEALSFKAFKIMSMVKKELGSYT